jgi:hypothetical protein
MRAKVKLPPGATMNETEPAGICQPHLNASAIAYHLTCWRCTEREIFRLVEPAGDHLEMRKLRVVERFLRVPVVDDKERIVVGITIARMIPHITLTIIAGRLRR